MLTHHLGSDGEREKKTETKTRQQERERMREKLENTKPKPIKICKTIATIFTKVESLVFLCMGKGA